MPINNNIAALRNLSALVDFSNLVNSSLDLDFIFGNILLTCFGKLHTTKGLIAIIDDEGILRAKITKGISKEIMETFPKIMFESYKQSSEFENFVKSNKFSLCEEIISYDAPRGLLLLGERFTKESYDNEDRRFLKTIVNIGATAIENSLTVKKLQEVNRDLDSKVNQLSSLFDLSKEFSSILEIERVSKMLAFSIIGQMLVTKFAVLTCQGNQFSVLESKFPIDELLGSLKTCSADVFIKPLFADELESNFNAVYKIGIELIVPMQLKGETKGLILLGSRRNKLKYTRSDVEYVSSVGSLAIISIENARLFKEALEKQRLEKDLEIARNIQNNLLPKTIPKLINFEIAAFNEPARRVSGDYYDLVKLDDNLLLFAIADVSGKGVQAALLMANLQAFLKSICKQNKKLDEATNFMNDLVSDNTIMGSFITFFWGIINDRTKEMVSVNAGHNPPLLIRDGKIQKLKIGGMILGVMQTVEPYRSERFNFQKGDTLILFTDGITEAMNIKGEEFTDERFEKLAVKLASDNVDRILDEIKTELSKFTHGAEQSDDITIIVIKVK